MKLDNPIPVRLTSDAIRDLAVLKGETGMAVGTLIRLAVVAGLPEIRKRHVITPAPRPRRPASTPLTR